MRIINLSILALAAVVAANAGAVAANAGTMVQIGERTSGIASTSNPLSDKGLTAAFIGTTGWSNATRSYSGVLFGGSTISGSSLTGSLTPTVSNGFQQFTDLGGTTFAMMSEGNTASQYWASATSSVTTNTTITIPVGIFNVNSAYIMLNDVWGVTGTASPKVTFNFATAGGIAFDLVMGTQIEGATHCASASPTYTGSPACTSFAQTTSATALTTTSNSWRANYTNGATGTANPYGGTSGTVGTGTSGLFLDNIRFDLSAHLGDTLNSITIVSQANALNSSRLALSAVSVDVVVPEPSSLFLGFAGLGALGVVLRRKKLSRS